MKILSKIAVTAIAVAIVAWLLPGIDLELTDASLVEKILTVAVIGAIFGVVNSVLKPLIKIVGCGFYVLTLGLISLLVNGLLLMLTAWIAGELNLPFEVDGIGSGILGALLIGVISWVINLLLPDSVSGD
ncbi:phage holin family protein [Haloglycomyces albus]|uniref:phage holin family protein n=1 Tax=Haloglycomyces albus TaxID=526067 RepID=UPI00046D0904|nr:phage holin family protein [Haloglycomyces albus]